MSVLLSVSVAVLAGLMMTRVVRPLKLPDVTAYLLAGVLIGPYCLGKLGIHGLGFTGEEAVASLTLMSEVALGFIAFAIGNEFRMGQLKSMGSKAITIGIIQAVVTTVLVDLVLIGLHLLFPNVISLPCALVLGAIASATAPAATLMVVRQYKADGPLTRLLLLVVTLLLVTILAFVAFSIIPGDPTDTILGLNATEEQVAALRAQLGLDLPLSVRYWNWLSGFVRGDLGESYNFNIPVTELLAGRISPTLTLTALAALLIVLFSIPLGLFAARYEGGWIDRILTVLNQIVMSVPNFVVGISLMFLFGLVLRWSSRAAMFLPSRVWAPICGLCCFPRWRWRCPKAP